jgi:hypothetical protein
MLMAAESMSNEDEQAVGGVEDESGDIFGTVSRAVLSSNEIVDSVDCWGRRSDFKLRAAIRHCCVRDRLIGGKPAAGRNGVKQLLISQPPWEAADMRSP